MPSRDEWPGRLPLDGLIESKGQEYILPIKVEDVELPGMQPTIGYLFLKDYDLRKLRTFSSPSWRPSSRMR